MSVELGGSLQRLSYDLPFLFKSNVSPDEALIVYVDEPSRKELDQPGDKSAWDHGLYAGLIDVLGDAGARTIVFDIIFNERIQEGGTEQLAESIRGHGNVILAAEIVTGSGPNPTQTLMSPDPPLEEAAAAVGLVSVEPDRDSGLRRIALSNVGYHQEINRSIAKVGAERHMQGPVETPASIHLNYYGPPYWLPSISIADALSSTNLAQMVSGKLVLVGSRPSTGFLDEKKDTFRTPFTRMDGSVGPGVEIVATATLNILRGEWLTPWPALNRFWIAMGVGLIGGFLMSCLRPWSALLVSVAGAAILAAFFMHSAITDRAWFPFMIPVAGQIPTALAIAVIGHTVRISRENRSLLAQNSMLEDRISSTSDLATASPKHPVPGSAAVVSEDEDAPTLVASSDGADQPGLIPDYDLIRMIGRGAFGEVWLARTMLGAWRALKIIRSDTDKGSASLSKEYEGVSRYDPVSRRHPNLVDILHLGKDPGGAFFYYVLELADPVEEGSVNPDTYAPRSVRSDLDRAIQPEPAVLQQRFIGLASALGHLHANGLLHRDIKPANIIYVDGVPKLADVGLVARTSEAHTFVGTYGYIPPEGPGTPAADVYSLGRVFEKMLLGEADKEARTSAERQLMEVILDAVSPDPSRRPPTGEILAQANERNSI